MVSCRGTLQEDMDLQSIVPFPVQPPVAAAAAATDTDRRLEIISRENDNKVRPFMVVALTNGIWKKWRRKSENSGISGRTSHGLTLIFNYVSKWTRD